MAECRRQGGGGTGGKCACSRPSMSSASTCSLEVLVPSRDKRSASMVSSATRLCTVSTEHSSSRQAAASEDTPVINGCATRTACAGANAGMRRPTCDGQAR